MKKYLSLLGVVSMGSSIAITSIVPITQEVKIQNNELNEQQKANEDFENLNDNQQLEINREMTIILNLPIDKVESYLNSSTNSFIQNNKLIILENLMMYDNFKKANQQMEINPQLDININWSLINDLTHMGFTDSNDYGVGVSWYNPSAWWKIWEWGIHINFNEGIVNVMRLVQFFTGFYKGIDSISLERFIPLLDKINELLDYFANIDSHADDSVTVIQKLITDTVDQIIKVGLPLGDEFSKLYNAILSGIEAIEKILPDVKVSTIMNLLNSTIQGIFKTDLTVQKIGAIFSPIVKVIVGGVKVSIEIVKIIIKIIPVKLIDWIIQQLINMVNSFVEADTNKDGVALILQQFIIPRGFTAK